MTDRFVRGCELCQPEILIPDLIDYDRWYYAERDYRVSVFHWGGDLVDVAEVMTGPDGWALRFVMPVHWCPCGGPFVEKILHVSDGFTVMTPGHAKMGP